MEMMAVMQRLTNPFPQQYLKSICTRSMLVVVIFLLAACGDPIKEQALQQLPITEQRVTQLGDALNNDQVRNATLIKQYAKKVAVLKPELTPLINEFKKDATTQGPHVFGIT